MILKASQRAGAKQLAVHLMRVDENDHVEVHQIRYFTSENIQGALREAYAISQGTKCRQFLFSVSFNPPEREKVDIKAFEKAIDALEQRVGLTGQPRVIVFHEKNGRRHAHCVWSRIKVDELRAVNLSHFKLKLTDLSREIYIEHGWKMPDGLVKSEARNPLNFTREEWQQAKRIKRDPRTIKEAFQDCWAISDSLPAFRNAMEARGYYIAQGDRRGYVAVDYTGEIYAIARWVGIKTKDVAARLGDAQKLPSVSEVQERISARLTEKVARFANEARQEFDTARLGLQAQRDKLVAWQRHERQNLRDHQIARFVQEHRVRNERFRQGLKGLWDRLTGRYSAIQVQNEKEIALCGLRDGAERQSLINLQLEERRALQRQIKNHQQRLDAELVNLRGPKNELEARAQVSESPTETRRRRRRQSPSFTPTPR
jgi:hypothetical protein